MAKKRQEVQYCVVFKEGSEVVGRKYFSAPKQKVQRIFDSCRFQTNKNILWMGHVARNYDKNAEIHFRERKRGSLEVVVHGMGDKAKIAANLCLKYWKIDPAFPELSS